MKIVASLILVSVLVCGCAVVSAEIEEATAKIDEIQIAKLRWCAGSGAWSFILSAVRRDDPNSWRIQGMFSIDGQNYCEGKE